MLYMEVTVAHWLASVTLPSLKLNGENHRKYVHNMATGHLYFVLQESLINVIQTTSTLKTLGSALGGNCGEKNALQEQRDRCSRLLEVALAINLFRADSLREHDSSYPMRFAFVLSDSLEQQRAAVQSFKEDFHFLLQMEERVRGDDGLLEVLRHIVWRQDPLVRLLFMLWDRPRGDEIDNEALEITKQMFDHQGDTRLNEESNRLCKQNTDFQTHSVCCETRDQYACIMGDILQHRKLGTTWEPDLEDSSVKLPSVSKLWHPQPHDLRMEWSSILSPDRKWSSPTPENERVGFVAWQWLQHFHREGLSADVRPNWSLLASLLPRGTVIRDARLEMTSLVFVPSRFGCQVLRLRSLPMLREGGKDIFEFQLHMPPTFCFPCRFTDINVIPCRPLPPSDTLVTTNGLSSDRIRLVATRAPIPAPQSRSQSVYGHVGHCFREGHPGAKMLRSVASSLFSRLQRRRFVGDGSRNV